MEVVVTSIQDGFPNWIKKKLVYHELLVLIVCVISFTFGLPNLIQVINLGVTLLTHTIKLRPKSTFIYIIHNIFYQLDFFFFFMLKKKTIIFLISLMK